MKRAELKRKTPLAPGNGFKAPAKPLARTPFKSANLGTGLPAMSTMKRRKSKHAPTVHESAYMAAVAALGCALCRRLGYGPTPAEVHHPRRGTGAGQRASHYDTIPLCFPHHRGDAGIHGMGVKAWMAHYGLSEADLTADTQHLLVAYLPADTDS